MFMGQLWFLSTRVILETFIEFPDMEFETHEQRESVFRCKGTTWKNDWKCIYRNSIMDNCGKVQYILGFYGIIKNYVEILIVIYYWLVKYCKFRVKEI